VIAEGHGWFFRRYDQNRAIQFLNFINELTLLRLQQVGKEELAKAGRLIKKFADQPLTLVDAHGLVIMNDRRIDTCWSTDRHLGLTGAELVV